MKPSCPNIQCNFYQKKQFIVKDGSYFRQDDARRIARFRCTSCGKRFSNTTQTLEWRQKKRRVNHLLLKLLASGVSMRRSAIILDIHQVTVKRKLIYLAKKSRMKHQEFLLSLEEADKKVKHMQFDDLITSEHTKMKPVTVSLAVDAQRRFILGIEVGSIPAFGKIAKKSREKYGKRKNEHIQKLHHLFSSIKNAIEPLALVESDEHQRYPEMIATHLPLCEYRQYKGGRGCIVGQGELKKINYDPLFKLNHTCAMLRANVNRLFRKTWCTTKNIEMLKNHLDIYIHFHNHYYL